MNVLQKSVSVGALLLISLPAFGTDWPQEISATENITIVVYQPQPDSLSGNTLSSRAAFSLEFADNREPIFGAMWFTATLETDRDAGTALVRDLRVTKVGWPDSKDADEQRFTQTVEAAVPTAGFEISLERLTASLESAKIERRSLDDLKTDPPVILFREELAVLLLYDGDPKFSPVDNSPYERALNTTFLVVRDTRSKRCYLSSGSLWYESRDPLGPFQPTDSPPEDLVSMLPKPDADTPPAPATPPEVVSATEPTELISTEGKPDWVSLTGGQLLYVQNTETAWLREIATGNMYVLLSGRWYRARSEQGPWTFVRADELPASFADIPPASDIGGVRVSVADTDEADQAMLDAAIPQTAAIKRDEAKLSVEYDGAPKFEPIAGTSVSYAVNTGSQVLEIDKVFYAVDDGVWFRADRATGPWIVADSVPQAEIDKIPPSSPVYNTTYVQIYDATPEVVYVGYTPGYMWSFPYYGVPVYGTGWYYPPYWGGRYYPRPPTWGLHVGYNPWTGWNFGVSWSSGFMRFGMSWGGGWGGAYRPWGCCGGWYGGGYRRPVVINTGNINIGNNVNIGNRAKISNEIGNQSLNRDRLSNNNLYKRPENRARNADAKSAREALQRARPAPDRANNVFADRNGAVARKTDNGWEARENGSWKQDLKSGAADRSRPAETKPDISQRNRDNFNASKFDRSGLNRDSRARELGGMRERSFGGARGMGGGGLRRR